MCGVGIYKKIIASEVYKIHVIWKLAVSIMLLLVPREREVLLGIHLIAEILETRWTI